MNWRKQFRVRFIGLMSMVLLLSQMAVAAYACPSLRGSTDPAAAATAGMPCAAMMATGAQLDPEQPALCLQHCQFGSTSHVLDHATSVFLPATALPAVFTVTVDDGLDSVLGSWAEDERLRQRPAPLTHSIAHCCYRL